MLGELCWAKALGICWGAVWWRDGGPGVTWVYQLTSSEISCVWWKHPTEFVSSQTCWWSHGRVLFSGSQLFFPMAPYTGSFQVQSCVQQDGKGRDSWGVQVVGEVSFACLLCLSHRCLFHILWELQRGRNASDHQISWGSRIVDFFFFDRVTCAVDTDLGNLCRQFGHLEASPVVSSYPKWGLSQAGWSGIKYQAGLNKQVNNTDMMTFGIHNKIYATCFIYNCSWSCKNLF